MHCAPSPCARPGCVEQPPAPTHPFPSLRDRSSHRLFFLIFRLHPLLPLPAPRRRLVRGLQVRITQFLTLREADELPVAACWPGGRLSHPSRRLNTLRRRVVILIHPTLSAPLWDKAVSRTAIPSWVPYDLFVLYLLYGVTGIANPGRGAFFRAVTAAVDLRSRGAIDAAPAFVMIHAAWRRLTPLPFAPAPAPLRFDSSGVTPLSPISPAQRSALKLKPDETISSQFQSRPCPCARLVFWAGFVDSIEITVRVVLRNEIVSLLLPFRVCYEFGILYLEQMP
ncbi:hypothetical protein B0H13DRAFT_2680556 [Mycena leptocephala]|nr:hypothetical protein B0H13DRAFT_2680556 [Mycena leptocephala]